MFDALCLDGCVGFVDAGFDLYGEGGLVGMRRGLGLEGLLIAKD